MYEVRYKEQYEDSQYPDGIKCTSSTVDQNASNLSDAKQRCDTNPDCHMLTHKLMRSNSGNDGTFELCFHETPSKKITIEKARKSNSNYYLYIKGQCLNIR